MKYVALLRGINVGGNNKISMLQLKTALEAAGFEAVSTYINSGNIFLSSPDSPTQIIKTVEQTITDEFGLSIKVLLRDKTNIDKILKTVPVQWKNNSEVKCDVMFLWEKYANKSVLQQLMIKPEFDRVEYIEGAIIWKVDKQFVTRSGLLKIVGTDLYAHMTIRNINTVRKIQERMSSN